MRTSRALGFTRAEIEAVLDNIASPDQADVKLAATLFDRDCVTLIDGRQRDLPEDVVCYELRTESDAMAFVRENVACERCALTNGTLARHRGALLKTGHRDLKCSRATCEHATCPFALAACFAALSSLGASTIPLYSEAIDLTQSISRFRRTWTPRLVNSDNALNLLLSRSEDDFSGILIVDDDAYLDEFAYDLSTILVKMGKIDEDGVKRVHISNIMRAVNSSDATFHTTRDENLEPRKLYLCDRISDFFQADPDTSFAARYIIERFGHIVDHRYLILVGTRDELAKFTGLSPTLELLLAEHALELAGMSAASIFDIYADKLDQPIKEMIDDEFREHFLRYVDFNRDALPFRGAELADFLAKTSNAAGTLKLPRSRYQSSSLDEMLDSIVGLDAVKKTIKELESYAVFSKRIRGRGMSAPSAGMHMLFSGNPGTGKTTVARIIATMLYKIGIISQNKFMEVTSKDLIARYVGHTDKQVFDVVQKARGGVLFIDEAYALAPNPDSASTFAQEALAQLVKCMEDYRDDLVVILAGYEREMQELVDLNPGLASRISYTFRFEDFTTAQLVEIFHRELKATGVAAEDEVDVQLAALFDYFRGFKSFGNGRFAREVVQKAIINHANRITRQQIEPQEDAGVITCQDIPTRREMLDALDVDERDAQELLAPLVGLDLAKEKVLELDHVVRFREKARACGMKLPDMNLHMVFTGNPGTGKTTIARIAGKVLFNIGAVPTGRFIEIEAKDLIKPTVGGSSEETSKLISSALGGVLFIDEAYALLESSSGLECIATLVKAMEDHKSELVVMFAGYENEMRRFLDANPGLASRVGYTFRFEDYETDELLEIFMRKMKAAGFNVADDARQAARDLMRYFHNVENFGNGRFVDRVIQETIARRATIGDAASEGKAAPNALIPTRSEQTIRNDAAGALAGAEDRTDALGETPHLAAEDAASGKLRAQGSPAKATTSANERIRRIGGEHIPTIEHMCKLTANAIYEPSDVSSAEARRRVAAHECGHALVRLALTGRTDIVAITIEQEGTGTLGYVQHERKSIALPTSRDIEDEVAVLMAGMAGEQAAFESHSAGNASDLEQATKLARRWAATWGMSGAGFVQFPEVAQARTAGPEHLPERVIEEMNGLMARSLACAIATIEENRKAFDAMVEAILEAETMTGDEICAIWKAASAGTQAKTDNE